MDKLSVNKQIVLMRRDVKFSQRCALQRINRYIANLESKLKKMKSIGNEKKAKCYETILSRRRQELQILKSISPDTVSKKALQTIESWNAIIRNAKTPIEDRVIAKIASNPRIIKLVKRFREENPNWELYLNTLLELWDEKNRIRNKGKKDEQKAKPEQKSEQNRVEEVKQKPAFSKQPKQINNVKGKETVIKQLKIENAVAKSSKDDEIEKLKTIDSEENDETLNESHSESDNEENKNSNTSESGTETFFKKESKNDDQDEENLATDSFFINKRTNFVFEDSPAKEEVNKKNMTTKKHLKIEPKKIKSESKKTKVPQKKINNEETSGPLHPSWEAKRKQRQQLKIDLNNCQSKKIRFAD